MSMKPFATQIQDSQEVGAPFLPHCHYHQSQVQ